MVRIGVVGYGTIGKRVVDAISKQDDMNIVGIVKTKPDYEALIALSKGIDVYTLPERIKLFEEKEVEVKGTIDDLIQKCDVIVDATPGGIGVRNKNQYYLKHDIKAIFQGGEKANVADVSFVAQANYEEAVNKRFIRVVSCNTTGISRILATFIENGLEIEKARVFIVRRGADPKEYGKGPINDIILNPPTIPSHHALDVKTIIPNIDIVTMAVAVPETLMHLHMMYITFSESISKNEILDILYRTPRIIVVESEMGFNSISQVIEWARDIGRIRYDIPENIVFKESITVDGKELYFFMAIHQESIVIPENIDAIRASLNMLSKWESIRKTDYSLGLIQEGKMYGE